MNPNDSRRELLLRYLDGRVTPGERLRVAELLRSDASAREFLRTVSEQAVMVADLERIAAGRAEALHPRRAVAEQRRKIVPANFRAWQWRGGGGSRHGAGRAGLSVSPERPAGNGPRDQGDWLQPILWFQRQNRKRADGGNVPGCRGHAGDTLMRCVD